MLTATERPVSLEDRAWPLAQGSSHINPLGALATQQRPARSLHRNAVKRSPLGRRPGPQAKAGQFEQNRDYAAYPTAAVPCLAGRKKHEPAGQGQFVSGPADLITSKERTMRRHTERGFTTSEIIVSVAIMGVVGGLVMSGVKTSQDVSRQTVCASNLKQISQGLVMFYKDYLAYPLDAAGHDLAADLAEYVPDKQAFWCPADPGKTPPNSYQEFYVARPTEGGGAEFIVGCPRHQGSHRTVNLFAQNAAEALGLAPVLANGRALNPSGAQAERTIAAGNFTFQGGSTAAITSSSPGFGMTLIESFRLADGTLYSVIRVTGDGTVDVSVVPGERFEIVTPSAIVGVRGTRFLVTTSGNGFQTDVSVTQGRVWVQSRVTGKITELAASESTTVTGTVTQLTKNGTGLGWTSARNPLATVGPPGQGGTPPGQGGTPPGQGGTPPGQGGTPPGQGGGKGGGKGS
ncbi:MAG: hypothetical protein FJ279_12180 [Planctomycetes bacterium]|nr:hypothetical protein [Planctomycetota bacterium]